MIKAIFLFSLAGLAEIGGGYLIWQWLREGASSWLGLLGGIALVLYGVIATWKAVLDSLDVYMQLTEVFLLF